jgi:hypothetical protein
VRTLHIPYTIQHDEHAEINEVGNGKKMGADVDEESKNDSGKDDETNEPDDELKTSEDDGVNMEKDNSTDSSDDSSDDNDSDNNMSGIDELDSD